MKDEELLNNIKAHGEEQYKKGLEDGLKVAEKIRCWLDVQPPQQYAQQVRGWAKTAIEKARHNANM